MELLLICLAALLGSTIADNTVWTDKLAEEILSSSSRNTKATVPELIAKVGYPVETHHVVTEDGYILEMHRIPGSPSSRPSSGKPVVFLMHGLLSSSADWIITGPENGFAYLLADAGYDVWMGNARGNTWSKNHTTITSNRRFWNFSWHQIGYYDLPAMIDYALEQTRHRQVIYIGHSQGTTSFYVMASERTEYNAKIKAMFSLAPVAYMGNLKSPVLRAASLGTTTISTLMHMVGWYEFMPSRDLVAAAGARFCNDDALSQLLCTNVLFLLCGFNPDQMNATILPTVVRYAPAGASTRQLVHYGQGIRSRRFRQLDLGRIRNRIVYGQWSPPDYDLRQITAPVHLVYSLNDWMADVRDVAQLYHELGNPVEMRLVRDPKWNHLDYIWGIDARAFVYDDIIATLRSRYSN